jgi:hypothetical protein
MGIEILAFRGDQPPSRGKRSVFYRHRTQRYAAVVCGKRGRSSIIQI